MSTTLDAALAYYRQGLSILPTDGIEKRPLLGSGWEKQKFDNEDEIRLHFRNPEVGIGVRLGRASNYLVDVDLDCEEAVKVAPYILPDTSAEFWRGTADSRHRLYCCRGAATTLYKHKNLGTIVELRGSTKGQDTPSHQTILPPSVHIDRETGAKTRRDWVDGKNNWKEPTEVDADELSQRVALTAAAALILKHYAGDGCRHEFALSLSGFLLVGGLDETDAQTVLTAVAHASGDREIEDRLSALRSTVETLARGSHVQQKPDLPDDVIKTLRTWLALKTHNGPTGRSAVQVDLLKKVLPKLSLWHSSSRTPFVTIMADGIAKNMPVRSSEFKEWLGYTCWNETRVTASEAVLRQVIDATAGMAVFEGAEREPKYRLASEQGAFWYDLGGTAGIVKVTADGWSVVPSKECPVAFVRSSQMKPLPLPERGGSLEMIGNLLGLEGDNAILATAWILGTCHPEIKYPVLVLYGQAGSGKTTRTAMARSFFDPASPETLGPPRNDDDVMVTGRHTHVLAFDNLASLSQSFSDLFCRVATGAGTAKRKNYTDDDAAAWSICRPVILNGITSFLRAPDLRSRSIIMELPAVTRRRTETALWEEFRAQHPKVLGAIFDAVVAGLRQGNATFDWYPRMADFAAWIQRIEVGGGVPWPRGTFQTAYEAAGRMAEFAAIEDDDIARALVKLGQLGFTGTWSQLASEMLNNPATRELTWMQTGRLKSSSLSPLIKRLAPTFETYGIRIERCRASDRTRERFVIIGTPEYCAEQKLKLPA